MRRRGNIVKSSNNPLKTILKPILIVLLGSFIVIVYLTTRETSNSAAINMVKKYMRSDGSINDFMGEIGVKDSKDIRWFIEEDILKVEFGKVAMTWSINKLHEKEVRQQMSTIGLEVRQNRKTKKLQLYWRGEKLEEWVR